MPPDLLDKMTLSNKRSSIIKLLVSGLRAVHAALFAGGFTTINARTAAQLDITSVIGEHTIKRIRYHLVGK